MQLTEYRDGIFSKATPAAQYQSQVQSYGDGSLGGCATCGLGDEAYDDGSLGAAMMAAGAGASAGYARAAAYKRLKRQLLMAAWGWAQKSIPMGTPVAAAFAEYEPYGAVQGVQGYLYFSMKGKILALSKKMALAAMAPTVVKGALAEYELHTGLSGLGALDTQTMILYGLGALAIGGIGYMVLGKKKQGRHKSNKKRR